MSQQRRHRIVSSTSASLIQDIDDEYKGWTHRLGDDESSPYHPAAKEISPEPISPDSDTPDVFEPTAEYQRNADAYDPLGTEEGITEVVEDDYDDLILRLTSGQEGNPRGTDGGKSSPKWEWNELDEFDASDDVNAEEDTSPGIVNYSSNRIALDSKAQRAAARILKESNWDPREGLSVLTEILMIHDCHAKTVSALRRLIIEVGVTPDTLAILNEIRSSWRAHGYNRIIAYDAFTKQREAKEGWLNLPWGVALHIAEKLGVQSTSEVMEFIEVCFTDWCEIGYNAFPIFAYYLKFVLSTVDAPFADTAHTAPEIARAMLTDRGEQYDLYGSPTYLELNALGFT